MKSNGKAIVSDDPIVKKPNGKDVVSSTVLDQPTGKKAVSSAKVHKVMPAVSSAVPIQPSGSTAVSSVKVDKVRSSAKVDKVLFFRDVSFGIQEGELRFRLIHFWEARNVLTKTLIGLEMLLIDEQRTVIQGFIPSARIDTYLPHMKAGSVYRLNKCFGSNSKVMYRVAEPRVVISFTSNSVLSDLEDSRVNFPDDRFRFHSYEEFEAACDLKGDLYDYVGHLKLVNGQTLNDSVVLDEEEIASTRRVLLHVQTHDGPVMKLYLWDQAAADFCAKFKSHGSTPRVILVTTVNPKRFGGALALASMSSSRVFLDFDVQPTRDYVTWLDSNLDVANRVDANVVTKTETMTIGELFSYIKQEAAKVTWFECTATVDAVFHGSPWYYIGCGVCHTKAIKGPTSLMCKKCGKHEVDGVPQYLTKLSVYDNNDHAVFVILGEAGRELTGKQASELVESYFEANESMGDDHLIPVPQTLVDTIGRTYRFIVKVSDRNIKGEIHTLTVTKVLPLDVPEPVKALVETVSEEPVDGRVKRGSEMVESGEAKRAKSGN
ncbi:replication protein A 70 kDa DNA-binding subunit A-like [Brassica rapa]|uniref:replication protein A 70 kDa DNA-binding subunit A-like n=1 Tax=Brassica campestris TaxID=3711 RepID=UPI0006AA9FF9|nr:replication protein A 70 kDa DNA-binding subunit A-like [Brassica rapa]XP_033135342.1 replication protein A 70 kDa DNA-binding subunit A-like [Brassica rapa]XP_033142364.1 replication protein A 70 kDa DNA-binding subunit A-like [Brassica rapa]XP_033144547.1 replication protein A 70 kDa DNA-binding subunit A-like [Brassica rapa]